MIIFIESQTIDTRIYSKTLTNSDSSLVPQTALNNMFFVPLSLDVLFDFIFVLRLSPAELVAEVFFVFLSGGVWSCFFGIWALNFYFEAFTFLGFEIVEVLFSVGVLGNVLVRIFFAKVVKAPEIKIVVLLLNFRLSETWKVSQAGKAFLFFVLLIT